MQAVILAQEVMFFWLCHTENLSNPAKRRRFSQRLDVLKNLVGAEAWGDTDDALDALRCGCKANIELGRQDMETERGLGSRTEHDTGSGPERAEA